MEVRWGEVLDSRYILKMEETKLTYGFNVGLSIFKASIICFGN